MNNLGKKIEVNASSLLDLKAELIRKQEEYRKTKLENGNVIRPKPTVKKPNIWSKQNTGVTNRGKADLHYEETPEEQDALKKSRQALEAKAKLYDKLTSGSIIPDEEQNSSYLVNFQQKAVDSIKQKKLEEENKKNEPEETFEDLMEDVPAASPDEEWVDYVDSLGRSRRCLRKDLSNLLEMDKRLGVARPEESELPSVTDPKQFHLLSDDMQRELRRKKWEEEAEAALSKPVGPVHYQTVQHEEIRDHGIGYFAFSQDELERKTQLESLTNLRQQTQDQRTRREMLKQKRKEQLKNRLAKVKQRQKQKLGIEGSSSEDDESKSLSDPEDNQDSKVPEEVSSEPMIGPQPKPLEEAKVPKVRPWDKGKIGVRAASYKPPEKKLMTQNEWVEKQRSNRQSDFAPPLFYYDTRPSYPPAADHRSQPPFFHQSAGYVSQPFAQPFTISSNTQNPIDSIPLPADPEPESSEPASVEERVSAMLAFYKAKSSANVPS